MKRVLLLAMTFVFLYYHEGLSQHKFTNTERANQLKEEYEDERVVSYGSKTRYDFVMEEDKLRIRQSDDVNLISLESNVKYARSVFYNDQISVKQGKARYASGKKGLRFEKVCGNYEVGDIFYSDAKVCSYLFNIIYEASEVNFTSEKVYEDPKYLTKVFFHEQDPTLVREISFAIPEGVDVELVEMNFEGFDIKKDVTEEMGSKVYKYTVEKIDELKSEDNSLGLLHYYPHIIVVTKKYQTSTGEEKVISKVEDLYEWYSGLVNKVDCDPDALSDKVKQLTSDAGSDEEKVKKIYYWVQENIKYIAFEDGIAAFQPESPQNVYTNKYGDCKGMAILTKTMLNLAGFDARLTWIGTNKIPYNYDLPSFAVDNHMICTMFLNDQLYILDPTEKYISLGEHGERIQGKEMLIEDGEHFIRKKVPIESSEKNIISRSENVRLDGMTLVGDGELVVNGESKKMILYFSTNSKVEDKDDLYDYLSVSNYSNTDNVEVLNVPETDRDKPLNIQYSYSLNNKVSSFEKDLYIELDWNKTFGGLEIEDDRFSDYYFGRKVNNKVVKTIALPKNYKVTHLPESIDATYNDISIHVNFKHVGNKIIYSNEIIIGSGMIKKDDFEKWNEIVKKLNNTYNDQIVLTKIS